MRRQRHLRPRRLVVDEELFRRRVQGATLRELAADYGVAHTTLGRHLRRPDASARLKAARIALRREERELRAEIRRAERERREEERERERERREASRRVRAEIERDAAAAGERAEGERVDREMSDAADMSDARVRFRPRVDRVPRSTTWERAGFRRDPYLDWLDLRDRGRALTRRERWSINDERAAEAVAAGGGMEEVVRVTGLRNEENVRRAIDPDIVADAQRNDAARLESVRSVI